MKVNAVALVILSNVAFLTGATSSRENPIRRIVNLLQQMQKETEQQGDEDKELMDKYACYCETNEAALTKSVEEYTNEIPTIESAIKEATAAKQQADEEVAAQTASRASAKASIDAAQSQRDTEAAAFAAESADAKENIEGSKIAVENLKKGLGRSFIQTKQAERLRHLVYTHVSDQYDGETIAAFLSTGTEGSGDAIGTLEQMGEYMTKELAEATEQENAAIAEFESLLVAKKKEIEAATTTIEAKTTQSGDLAVKLSSLKHDLEDAVKALADDQSFLADLKKECKIKMDEYEVRKKMRADETLAIGETIKILNDDDALDLFKKTLPSPNAVSLLQVTGDEDETRDNAMVFIDSLPRSPKLGLIMMALKGKKNFDQVMTMIDNLVVELKKEQTDDDTHKAWCEKEFDTTDDKKKDLGRTIESQGTKIKEGEEAIEALKAEIAALTKGITDLDLSVTEATAQRKKEHDYYSQTQAENNAALQLLGVAKNRLNKFYNPTLHKEAPKRELTESERIYANSGGELAEEQPGGIANTGITAFVQVREAVFGPPPPPPETAGAYKKKDASGPIELIDMLAADLRSEMEECDRDEKDAQTEYETFVEDSKVKRTQDSTAITEKESQKGGLEETLLGLKADKKSSEKELLTLNEYIASVHSSCDFLLENFNLRKEARGNEIDSLSKAKATLSGADYEFIQMRSFLSRRHRH